MNWFVFLKTLFSVIPNSNGINYDGLCFNYATKENIEKEELAISEHIKFVQSISEADLVIYNIASSLNNRKILIYSADTDYFALCSDLKNVYKTEIALYSKKNVFILLNGIAKKPFR